MVSENKISPNEVLDRAHIRTLTLELSREQQNLAKDLPGAVDTTSQPTSVDYKTWHQCRADVFTTFHKLQDIMDKAEKIQPENSTSEWQSAVLSLQEADEMVRVLVLFTTACNRLETCAAAKSANKFAELAQELAEVKRVLAELGREERYGLKVISSLKAMRMELQSALTTTVEAEWNNLIVVRKDTIDPAENTEVIGIQMNLSSGTNRPYSAVLEDVTQCAKSLRIFDRFAQELAEGLLEGVVAPVMDGRATVRVSADPKPTLFLVFETSTSGMPVAILDEIYHVFDFIGSCLAKPGQENRSRDLMLGLESHVGTRLAGLVRSGGIAGHMPDSFGQFEAAKSALLSKLREFEALLKNIGWTSAPNLWHYKESDLEEIYIEKCAQNFLVMARKLFMSEKDFLNAVSKSVGEDLEHLDTGPVDASLNDPAIFALQEMSISSSMSAVMDRSEELLEEALRYPSASLLVPFIYNAFSMFLDLVPFHFKERLMSIPSLGGLYFTSCIHASLHLYLLNRMLRRVASDSSGMPPSYCFTDLILKFRIQAYEILKAMVSRYTKEILETINSNQAVWLPKIGQMQLANLVDRTVLKSGVDLLHRLAAVWRTILPRIVFLQAIGKIIGEMLNDISYRLISVEDINATDSTILCGNFLWLLAEAENVLKVGDADGQTSAPFKYVPSWMRFKEIIFVLDASMTGIAERWADHNGPLAEHLLPEELKKLVRSLFENNEKRARLLAAIK